MSNDIGTKIKTIFTPSELRVWGFDISIHLPDDKLLKAAREMEQNYLRAWAGDDLFNWLTLQNSKENNKQFFDSLSEVIARLTYCRLLLDNMKITRMKAVEKKNEFSQQVQIEAIKSEINTQRLIAKSLFFDLEIPTNAPNKNPKEPKIYLLNEYFVGA